MLSFYFDFFNFLLFCLLFLELEIGKMHFSNQANFTLTVPDSAYVSAFSVEVGGRLFEARIEPSDEGVEEFW